jgi:hypothetical protein
LTGTADLAAAGGRNTAGRDRPLHLALKRPRRRPARPSQDFCGGRGRDHRLLAMIGSVIAAAADVARAVVTAVPAVPDCGIPAHLVTADLVTGVADVPDGVVSALPGLRDDGNGGRCDAGYDQCGLQTVKAHGGLLLVVCPRNNVGHAESQNQVDLRRIAVGTQLAAVAAASSDGAGRASSSGKI